MSKAFLLENKRIQLLNISTENRQNETGSCFQSFQNIYYAYKDHLYVHVAQSYKTKVKSGVKHNYRNPYILDTSYHKKITLFSSYHKTVAYTNVHYLTSRVKPIYNVLLPLTTMTNEKTAAQNRF